MPGYPHPPASYYPDVVYYNGDQHKPSFHLVSFFAPIPSHRVSVLSVIPRPCSKTSLLPPATWVQTRPVFPVLHQDIVLSLVGWYQPIASIVFVANGISFAIMTAIFTTIDSAAEYGTFDRWLSFTVTLICWAAQYACMALTCTYMSGDVVARSTMSSRSGSLETRYVVGFVSYGATLVFTLLHSPVSHGIPLILAL